MRKPALFAAASLAFLPAFGARAAEPSPTETAAPSSPDTVVAPVDFAGAAPPVLTIDTLHIANKLDSAFRVTFHFSDTVTGFTLTDIKLHNASTYSDLLPYPEDRDPEADTMFVVSITVRSIKGDVTIWVDADEAENKQGEGNLTDTMKFAVDNQAPKLEEATASGDTVLLRYHEKLDEAYEPPPVEGPCGSDQGFCVDVTDSTGDRRAGLNVTDVRVREHGNTFGIYLILNDTIKSGDTIEVTYVHNGTTNARDERGNLVPSLDAHLAKNTRNVPPVPPDTVRNLLATAISESMIYVSWDTVADPGSHPVDDYLVEAYEDGSEPWDTLVVVDHPSLEYSHRDLEKGKKWHYRVTARSEAGDGKASRTVFARTLGGEPGKPDSLVARAEGSDKIRLDWPVPDPGGADIKGYLIEVSNTGSEPWDTLAELHGDTTRTHRDLDPGATRHYRVAAINEVGAGPYSDVESAKTDPVVPGKPDPLVARPVGSDKIKLEWPVPDSGGAEITGYLVEVSETGSEPWDTLRERNSDTTYTHRDLDPGATRHYRVAAINEVGAGPYSDVESAKTDPVVPGKPDPLVARAEGSDKIKLDWLAPDSGGAEITGYLVEVSSTGSEPWDTLRERNSDTTYTHRNLDPGATRHYRVAAINEAGAGPYSDVESAKTDPVVPGKPDPLLARAEGSDKIKLEWPVPDSGGAEITGYLVEVSETGSEPWDTLRERYSDTTYTHRDLEPGTTRHYRVAAINEAGAGPYSDVESARTDPVVPGKPDPLLARAGGSDEINLSWPVPDPGGAEIEGYLIEVSSTGSEPWDTLRERYSDTTYTHRDLEPGTTRHYRVAAINEAGAGPYSDVESATTDPVVPDAPTGLEAEKNGPYEIDLSWTAPVDSGGAEITGYVVEVSETGSEPWDSLAHVAATSYAHGNLEPATTRHYRVSAINAAGVGDPSEPASATTDPVVPDAPTGLEAEKNGPYEIDLSWTAPGYDGGAEITGYVVEVSETGSEPWDSLAHVAATSYAHGNLEPATTRHYRVSAINAAGVGDPSEPASATTDPVVPDAPTGLEAEKNGPYEINLSWTAPVDSGGAEITGYVVEVSETGSGAWDSLAHVAATSYAHGNLDPATTRHYRVSAVNAAGVGDPSEPASATTDPVVPDAPTGLEAEKNGPYEIDLSWTAPGYDGGAEITGYVVEVSETGSEPWDSLAHVTATSYAHGNLEPATTRHYRVSAVNAAGVGDPSEPASATTDPVVPDAPTGLEAEKNGPYEIDLSWTAPGYDGGAEITGYVVEVSETGSGAWDSLAHVAATSYAHGNLDPATTRHYRVSAVNAAGVGDPSEPASATTDPVVPDAPTGLDAEKNGPYEINLSWTAPGYDGGAEITGYVVEVSETGSEPWDSLAHVTATSYAHGNLDPATTRHYRVSAVNAAGVGDPSEPASATTDPVVPDAPTGLDAEKNGPYEINLSWTAPEYDGGADITGYLVEVSETGSGAWDSLAHVAATSYAHGNLDPATTRHYRVSAVNAAGVGDPSEPASATTDPVVPDAPTGLDAEKNGPYEINLSWTAPEYDGGADITGYLVEVSETGSEAWDSLAHVTATSYAHGNLDPATTRHYRVSAVNAAGVGDPSEPASATTDAIPPDPPTGLTATAVSPTQIDLAWVAPEYDGGAEITGYQIEMSADSAATWAILEASTGSTATVYAHTGLVPGSTRFYRVSAINVAGPGEPSNVASASTDDPVGRAGRVNQAILPHFAAASTTSALNAIAARIEAVADRNPLTSQLKAAGLASLVGRAGRDGALSSRLIDGMSFAMPLGGGEDTEGLGVATWGSAEYTSMSDLENEEVTWEGGLLSLHLGVDVRVDRDFLVGVSAGRSSGTYDFTDLTGVRDVSGTYEARMNSLYPYIAWLPGRTGVAVWGVSGFGWGEVVVDDTLAGRRIGTARSMTGALGASRLLAASGGSKLRVRTEGWASRVKVDGDAQMDSLTIDMQRGRLALEWSQGRSFGGGDEVVFMLEGGARFGRSDGTEGVGMEVGGGLRYNNPAAGLTLEGRARLLSAGSGYRETGIRGLLQVDPQGSDGLSVKIVPSVGDAASSVDELWDRGVGQLVQGGSVLARRVDASVEYGFAGFHGTPYSRIRMVDGGSQSIGTGVRYDLAELLKVQVEGTRNQGGVGPARHAVSLRGQLVF